MSKAKFCSDLKEKREKKLGKTLEDMKILTDLSPGYLSLFESGGIKKPKTDTMRKIAAAYEVNFKKMAEAFYGSDEEAEKQIHLDILIKQLEADEKLKIGKFVRDALDEGLEEKGKILVIKLYELFINKNKPKKKKLL